MNGKFYWGFIVLLSSLALAGWHTYFEVLLSLLYVLVTAIILYFSGLWIWQSFHGFSRGDHKFIAFPLKVIDVLIGLVVYL